MLNKKIANINVGIKSEFYSFYSFPDFNKYPDSKGDNDIEFNLIKDHVEEVQGTRVGNFVIGNGLIYFQNSNYQITIDYRKEKIIVTATVSYTKKQLLAKRMDRLYKLYSYEYESIDVRLARGFIYYVINPVIQLMFVRSGTSFIHGSTISFNNKSAYLFTGWGGSGKTSTSSALLFDDNNYQFMSDDLAIINSDKVVYNNPAISHIYPYNVVGFEDLENIITKNTSKVDRLHWNLRKKYLGINKVRRRVDPETIYNINSNLNILSSKVFYFIRNDSEKLEHILMTTVDAVNSSINVTNFEIKGLLDLFSSLYSIPSSELSYENDYPGFSKLFGIKNDYFTLLSVIYKSYLDGQEVYYIKVPKKTSPKALKKYLQDNQLV